MNTLLKAKEDEKQRRVASASVNRELKSHQRNCVQSRLLQESNDREGRNLRREAKANQHIKKELVDQHELLMSRTPSVSDWMKQHASQYSNWKERERERLEKRHRALNRQYKVPPVLSLDPSGMQHGSSGVEPLGKNTTPQVSTAGLEGDTVITGSTLPFRRLNSDSVTRTSSLQRDYNRDPDSRYPRRHSESVADART